MKEILKYLRQINFYTQEDVAKKLDVSRQWYIRYENGKVIPSNEIVKKLSEIYNVSEEFIYQNKIPSVSDFQGNNVDRKVAYQIKDKDFGKLSLADSVAIATANPSVDVKTEEKELLPIEIEGYFDGKSIQVDTPDDIQQSFFQGQRFKIIPLYDEEAEKKKEAAWKKLQSLVGSIKPLKMPVDEDPYYKEMIQEALENRLKKK